MDRREALVTLGAGLAGLVSGCATVPNFFTCNQWVDSNQDGIISDWEFQGVKSQFRTYEPITLVAKFFGKKGANIGYKIKNPSGKIMEEETSTAPYDNSVWKSTIEGRKLKEMGGVGEYKIEWYLENNVVNVTNFTLIE